MIDISGFTSEKIDALFSRERIEKIEEARRYYANQNDICQNKRMIVSPDGNLIESKFLTNNCLSHPFTRKIVEQKVAYLLGKPFNIEGDDEQLIETAIEFFGKSFMRTLRTVCRDAILCGESWIMVYYDENGRLMMRCVKPENIAAVYTDETHEKIQNVIRRYKTNDDDDFTYEIWNDYEVATFKISNGKLILTGARHHFGDGENAGGFGRVPFVQFRYNANELGILTFIKSLIDDYDKNASDLSNLLQDSPNTMRIIKGYGDNIETLVKNMALFNMVQVAPESDITSLQNPIDIAAREAHMTRLRKDILDSACAVDTQEASQGNLSGVAIKFRFADLDLDCQQMGSEFAASMESLTWFICEDMKASGKGEHEPSSINFIWATELIANEQEIIQNLQNSAEILSLETRISQHPYVNDPDAEMKRIKDEQNYTPGEL